MPDPSSPSAFVRYRHEKDPDRPKEDRYLASPELATAVNTAISLKRPLLVAGEPGCGKTQLAYSIARQLGCELLRFDTRSDSRAEDCLYSFDALRRLYDAQAQRAEAQDPGEYCKLQALGAAIAAKALKVVLIDEVDKAPRDFCNGLLGVLEADAFSRAQKPLRFIVPETRAEYFLENLEHWPIVVVTTNEERTLPDAFLRRCVFVHLPFPAEERLRAILEVHFPEQAQGALLTRAVEYVLTLRNQPLEKRPGSAELIDWLHAVLQAGRQSLLLSEVKEGELQAFLGALLKTRADLEVATQDRGR